MRNPFHTPFVAVFQNEVLLSRLYNPLLFQLWDYSSLIGGPNRIWIFEHRAYVLGLSAIFIGLALLAYPRRSLRRR